MLAALFFTSTPSCAAASSQSLHKHIHITHKNALLYRTITMQSCGKVAHFAALFHNREIQLPFL